MKNQTICIITANHLESENPARNRVMSLVDGFLRHGYHVELISMDSVDYILCDNKNFKHHKVEFVNVKINSFFKRAYLEVKLAYQVLRKANGLKSDLNLITIPSMFLLHLAFILKNRKLNILDIRDLSWEYLSDKSFIQRWSKKILRFSAISNFRKFDIIDVTNNKEFEYISAFFPKSSVFRLTNGVSKKIYDEVSNLDRNIEHDKINITYIGNIGLAQDLSTLIECSKILLNFNFNIVGNGTDFDRIYKMVDKDQNNIKFFGQVNFECIRKLYSQSDILYAQLSEDYSGAMPSKLYEYLATGKYVVYGGGDVAKNILTEFENISIISPQNVEMLKNTLLEVSSKQLFRKKSKINQNIIDAKYVRENSVDDYIQFINNRLV